MYVCVCVRVCMCVRAACIPGCPLRSMEDEEDSWGADGYSDTGSEFEGEGSEGEGAGGDDDAAVDDELGVVVPDTLVGTYAWAEPVPHPTSFDRNVSALFRLVLVPGVDRVDFEPSIPDVRVCTRGAPLCACRRAEGWLRGLAPTAASTIPNCFPFPHPPLLPYALQVEAALLNTLDDVVARVSEVTSPEHQLLRLLHLAPRRLLPLTDLQSGLPLPDNCASSVARLSAAKCV
jgi:hypothetical protein